ncbi:hypothetical protein [Cellulosimicrobium sp. CpK407]|uniref:hypothetical protein n=1 Tax=Cellulosimicrobium sp. CpK407 TaxID=3229847 RepID=UPI003F412FE4
MKASFAEVLVREATALDAVADSADLDQWRRALVDLATNAETAYARVLRPTGDPQERADFLASWGDLIAAALARVLTNEHREHLGIDVRQMAVSVLAALYGGTILSRVARGSQPLRTSVELALAPLVPPANTPSAHVEQTGPSVP